MILQITKDIENWFEEVYVLVMQQHVSYVVV